MINQLALLFLTSSMFSVAWGNGVPVTGIHNIDTLKSNYSPATKQRYMQYLNKYAQVKTLQDFKNIYTQASEATENFSAPLQKEWEAWSLLSDNAKPGVKLPPQPSFQWAEKAFPGIDVQLVAEGTQVNLAPSWVKLAKLAKKTPSFQDDQFTSLMQELHGDSWSYYPNWMVQTWDYGGCSRMGSGKHTYFLTQLQKQIKMDSVFKKELISQQKSLIDNMITSKNYCGTKAAALQELSQMQKQFSWSNQQKKSLKSQYHLIQSGKVEFGSAL